MQAKSHMDNVHDRAKEEYQHDKEPDVDGVLPVIFISPHICPENDPHQRQSAQNEINKRSYITPPEVQRRVKGKTPAECGAK